MSGRVLVFCTCLAAFLGGGALAFANWDGLTGTDNSKPRVVGLGPDAVPALHYHHRHARHRAEAGSIESTGPTEDPGLPEGGPLPEEPPAGTGEGGEPEEVDHTPSDAQTGLPAKPSGSTIEE